MNTMRFFKKKCACIFMFAFIFTIGLLSTTTYAHHKKEEICYIKLSQISSLSYQSKYDEREDSYELERDKNSYIFHYSFWAQEDDAWGVHRYTQKLKLKSEKRKCKDLFKYFASIKNDPDHATYNKKSLYLYVADVYYSTFDNKGRYNRETSRSERYYFTEKEYNLLVKQFKKTRKYQTIENICYYRYGEDKYHYNGFSIDLLYNDASTMYSFRFGFGCDTSFGVHDKNGRVTSCQFGENKTKEILSFINKIEISMKAYDPYHENKEGVMVTEYKKRTIKVCFGDISGDYYQLPKKEYKKLLKKCKELQKIAEKYK